MNHGTRSQTYAVGDRVRIDIPDETHPNHKHHGRNGEIIAVISGAHQSGMGGLQSGRYRVELDTGGAVDVEAHYLRPPI